MSNFEIIPVIDILNSKAVHAVKGERSKYKPLKSYLFNSNYPKEIIKILKIKVNFPKFYIADLDAIMNKRPNIELITEISMDLKIKILLDSGIENRGDLKKYINLGIHKLIFGLETILDYNTITAGLQILGKNRIIVSIDMYNGKIISKNEEIKNRGIIKVIQKIEDLGVREIILLDLFRIGQKLGGIPKLYDNIKREFHGKIYVGGGIKDINDIKLYIRREFSGVLIGTALYDGTININELKSIM